MKSLTQQETHRAIELLYEIVRPGDPGDSLWRYIEEARRLLGCEAENQTPANRPRRGRPPKRPAVKREAA
jgi:hypothetical protein